MGMKLPPELDAKIRAEADRQESARRATAATGPTKYRNKRVYRTPDGLVVGDEHPGPKTKIADSRREYRRLLVLLAEQKAGSIQWLRTQVRFKLVVNGLLICRYVADFVYIRDGRQVVEDSKGARTDVYKLKKALLKAIYNIDILET